jgi:hypothetical protein
VNFKQWRDTKKTKKFLKQKGLSSFIALMDKEMVKSLLRNFDRQTRLGKTSKYLNNSVSSKILSDLPNVEPIEKEEFEDQFECSKPLHPSVQIFSLTAKNKQSYNKGDSRAGKPKVLNFVSPIKQQLPTAGKSMNKLLKKNNGSNFYGTNLKMSESTWKPEIMMMGPSESQHQQSDKVIDNINDMSRMKDQSQDLFEPTILQQQPDHSLQENIEDFKTKLPNTPMNNEYASNDISEKSENKEADPSLDKTRERFKEKLNILKQVFSKGNK